MATFFRQFSDEENKKKSKQIGQEKVALTITGAGVQCIQLFFSKTLFDFKKLISGPIKLKFSGKTLNAILLAPMYFWGVYF